MNDALEYSLPPDSESPLPHAVDDYSDIFHSGELIRTLDCVNQAIVWLDESYTILNVNVVAEQWLGYEASALKGRSCLFLFPDASQQKVSQWLEEELLQRSAIPQPLTPSKKSTNAYPQVAFSLSSTPSTTLLPPIGESKTSFLFYNRARKLFSAQAKIALVSLGPPFKFCLILTGEPAPFLLPKDILDANIVPPADLSPADPMPKSSSEGDLRNFLARLTHEIRTPLNAILGFTELMMGDRFSDVSGDRFKEYIQYIHLSGSHALNLLNDLLDLFKIEAGKRIPILSIFNPNHIIQECAQVMQAQALKERILIRSSLEAKISFMQGDARALRQILLNVLSNAIKFNVAGGHVLLTSYLNAAGHLCISVRDNGIGMSEEDLVYAVEPFRCLSESKTPGSGLGLAVTKALIEAHEGTFVIKSKKNAGTLIEMSLPFLPFSDPKSETQAAETQQESPTSITSIRHSSSTSTPILSPDLISFPELSY